MRYRLTLKIGPRYPVFETQEETEHSFQCQMKYYGPVSIAYEIGAGHILVHDSKVEELDL